MIQVQIVGTGSSGSQLNVASVTPTGELVIGKPFYDDTVFNELAEDDTAYNYYEPRMNEQFVITNIHAYGDKQVAGNTNATVVLYEASAVDTLVVDKVLTQFEIGQNQALPYQNLNLLVNQGKYINAKTDDDDVHMTIMGHFIPEIIA